MNGALPERAKPSAGDMKRGTIDIEGLSVVEARPYNAQRRHPILFIHGMWGGAWVWNQYLEYFCRLGYHCYALNLRGRPGSRSVPDIGKVSIHDYIQDARTVAT